MIENWKLCWQMIARVHDPVNGWGKVQAPFHKVKSERCTRPLPTYNVYCHAHSRPLHVSPCRPNGARTCTTLSGVEGVIADTPTQAKCSHATLCHTCLPRVPFKKSWVNKSWVPHSLSAATYGPVSLPHVHVLGRKTAASETEGVGIPGELVRAQLPVVLLPDLCHASHGSLTLCPPPA